MHKFGVVIALETLRDARKKWQDASREFQSGYDLVLQRLLHEGLANYMSAAEIATVLGVSTKVVRNKMRSAGLDPKSGKRVLSKQASEALVGNATLLGITPHELDLTSPLAYLPMGEQMKRALEDAQMAMDTEAEVLEELSGGVTDEMIEAFRAAWLLADAQGLEGERVRAGLLAALAVQA